MGRDWHWKTGAKPTHSAPTTTLPGCITAVFHLFRFHSPLNHQNTTASTRSRRLPSPSCTSFFSQHTTTTMAGTEAPRNSLESEEESSMSASFASTSKEDGILNIPMGIQIKTSGDIRSKVGAQENDIDTPGGTKTPTLVARLMGLDLLPETHSPSFQTSSLDGDTRGGTRSLPVTPRISSARRSDVDHHHRLSLQINKENMSATEELIMSRLSSLMKRKELKHEYVKQVKESVARKVGMNITNAVRNREELVSHFKYKKISAFAHDSTIVKHSTHSSLKSLVSKTKTKSKSKSSFSSSPRIQNQTSHKLQPVEEEQDEQRQQPHPSAASKCKKGSNKKFVSRLKKPQQALEIIRNKKEESFVRPPTANRVNIPDKKCRKIPLSNDLLNSKVPTLLLKKHPSPPATKIPQKQVLHAQRPKHGSSSSTPTYIKQEPGQASNASITTTISAAGGEAEYEYITRILRRAGLKKDTQVSISSWFSPSHPLDPSIFHHLEHSTTSSSNDNDKNNETKSSQSSRRCNRKLLFHLVDELLSEILKPCFNMKPWVNTVGVGRGFRYTDGSRLIDTLCSRIRSFPRSGCRVLEDIDALIGGDLPDVKVQSVMAYEEQGEGIVAEIEKDILETLVYELAVDFGGRV
ncbi:TON1 Recruiting Motif 25 [Hibiscus trionum]|uniref:TON1 Recruiting Motif 25 n=1 Tax=Hibiscus trionum TaxID=183268 RepID=A0A9W7H5W2_HIBTR|nr:TON1 Recruiting Motif 25 [Hibiscus trionum]